MNSPDPSSLRDDEGGSKPRLVHVDSASSGQRIDNFLLRFMKGVPRGHLYRILRRGEVRVNKGRVKAGYRVQEGDVVRIPPVRIAEPREPGKAPDAQLARLDRSILYEDERLLVVDKPAGLAVHGGSGLSYGLIESLRQLRPDRELELVHRLDRETSGCLLIAKRRSTLRELHQSFRDGHDLEKRYTALLIGELDRPELVVDAPLHKNVLRGGERMVMVDPEQGKPSRTRFRRLRRYPFGAGVLTLVEATLMTGRTHQIRVHAAHLGSPLAGDPKYGDEAANRLLKAHGLTRLFLHASQLQLKVGHLERPLNVVAPLPEELERFLTALETET